MVVSIRCAAVAAELRNNLVFLFYFLTQCSIGGEFSRPMQDRQTGIRIALDSHLRFDITATAAVRAGFATPGSQSAHNCHCPPYARIARTGCRLVRSRSTARRRCFPPSRVACPTIHAGPIVVGCCHAGNACRRPFLRQPLLMGAEHPLTAPARRWRISHNHFDTQLFPCPAKLSGVGLVHLATRCRGMPVVTAALRVKRTE